MTSKSNGLVEVYDAAYARQQELPKIQYQEGHAPRVPQSTWRPSEKEALKMANALAKATESLRVRDDTREKERQLRDPSYRPDAIELSQANLLPFEKYTDYYERLDVEEFASTSEIRAASAEHPNSGPLPVALHTSHPVSKCWHSVRLGWQAFKKISLECHPDKMSGKEAEEKEAALSRFLT